MWVEIADVYTVGKAHFRLTRICSLRASRVLPRIISTIKSCHVSFA